MEKQLNFLLIDDDADDRELFEIALENMTNKVNCTSAASCSEALQMLNSEHVKPDYIFLDLNMPQMSGRECLAALKQTIKLANIPVIIFSTSSDPRDRSDTQEMGAIDFITKPSKTSELSRLLDHFVTSQLHKNIKTINSKS